MKAQMLMRWPDSYRLLISNGQTRQPEVILRRSRARERSR